MIEENERELVDYATKLQKKDIEILDNVIVNVDETKNVSNFVYFHICDFPSL